VDREEGGCSKSKGSGEVKGGVGELTGRREVAARVRGAGRSRGGG
jgi:hypothetical protein